MPKTLKFLKLKMENGDIYQVDVEKIVENKGEYRFDMHPEDYVSIEDALDEVRIEFYHDNFEAEDWMKNNMSWSELDASLIFTKPKSEEPEDWYNSQITYVTEKEE